MGYNRTLGHFTNSQELATVWASGQNYIVNQLVLDNNKLYRCITAHTSGATFAGDSAYWSGLNPGATVAISEGGTGQTTQTAAFDALAPSTTAGDLIVYNGTDNVRLPVGSDGQTLVADATQTNKLKWATIPQGNKNYITYSNFENNATTGWSLFNTTLTSLIPTGSITAGAASLNALSVTSSSPLAGTYSLSVSSPAAVSAGQGFITDVLTIDREDQAKVLTFSFYYETVSGTMDFSGTSANTWAIYIHDGTNWIQPAGVYGMTQSSGSGLVTGTFQTNSTGTSYRLAVVCINATGGAISMKFDDFKLGPQTAPIGPVVTDWVSYTPTVTTSSGSLTNATHTGRWRRVGDSIEVRVTTQFSAASAAFTGPSYSLPSGLSFDTSKFSDVIETNLGISRFLDAGIMMYPTAPAVYTDATRFQPRYVVSNSAGQPSQVGSVTNTLPFTFGATGTQDTIETEIMAPIAGWSSAVQQSSDTDTRVVAARYTTASGSTGGRIQFNTLDFDTHAATTTGASWAYVAPVSGIYEVSCYVQTSGNIGQNGLTILSSSNPGQTIGAFGSSGVSATVVQGTGTIRLSAGDNFYISLGGTPVSILTGWVTVKRLSGPSVVAASETVACSYDSGGAQVNIPNNSVTTCTVFTNRIFDTHMAFSSGGIFTAPVSGKYSVSVGFQWGTNGTGQRVVYAVTNTSTRLGYQQASAAANTHNTFTGIVSVQAGETITIRAFQNSGGLLANTVDASANYVGIVRVGN